MKREEPDLLKFGRKIHLEQELLVTTRLTGIFRFAGRRRYIVPRSGGDRRGLGRWRVAAQELAGSTATKICLRK